MEQLSINLNNYVKVKIKDKGIIHYVKKYNETRPFEHHLSFNEYKSKADPDGYHIMQFREFVDDFGCKGTEIVELVEMDIIIFKEDVRPVEG